MAPSTPTSDVHPTSPVHHENATYRDDATSTVSSDETVIYDEATALLQHDEMTSSHQATPSDEPPSRLQKYVPKRIHRWTLAVVNWGKGPNPPRTYKIRPFFPKIQTAPLRLLDRYLPKKKHRIMLLAFALFCWLLAFSAVLHASAFASDVPGGYGSPVRLSCTAQFWSDFNYCGTNGELCRPFDDTTFAFRCPANCKRVRVLNPHAVGAQEINYKSLVVGGPTDPQNPFDSAQYRGDSFICGSAIHAGFITNDAGGCGALRLTGQQKNYPAVSSHGISSIPFDSYFPMSFTFLGDTESSCADLRWPLLAVSLTGTILISLFTTSPGVFFWTIFIGVFFHVALASDPPDLTDYYSIVSITLGSFLPAAFCAFVIYRYCAIRQLKGLNAQIEKTILWVGPLWVGAFNNYTFDKIPIERLTPHDIHQQPGAIPALIIIVLAIVAIALGQAWAIRVEGRLPQYLALYLTMGLCLVLLLAVPNMNLRIHHYILALLLLPGTAMQNRPSLVYQGLLVGLFINGIARWGFDSILQTPDELRGDARLGTALPKVMPPIIHPNTDLDIPANITFEWKRPFPQGFDGISVLVNDVERFRGYEDMGIESFGSFTWEKHIDNLPEYFRFGYMKGSSAGDFTKAGTWEADGSWTEMKKGPSR